jgi:hypothetical protein
MRFPIALFCALVWLVSGARAEFQFSSPDWAIEIKFESKPSTDQVATPTPQGDIKAQRYFLQRSGENYLLVRFVYPLALIPGDEPALYDKSLKELMKSRPGEVKGTEQFAVGPFNGYKITIAQPRERTIRELRMIIIGSSLYLASAEWPAVDKSAASRGERFLGSMTVHVNFADIRAVDERERWREIGSGNFRLRYDAARWYRDPADEEAGIYNLLRSDQLAEAQLIIEDHPVPGNDIEEAVLATAREGADRVTVKKRAKKIRGQVQVSEMQFIATVEKVDYLNHGYFYSGKEGSVQLRAWATHKNHAAVVSEMEELIDGLKVLSAPAVSR